MTAISPESGPPSGGQSVTITGTGFTGATAVTIGGAAVASLSVSSSTSITAKTPAHAVGAASVLVTTPGGTNAANMLYTYVQPAPTVTAISPSSGPTSGGQSVRIMGTNLTGAKSITIGGATVASFSVSNSTSITAKTPPGTVGPASVRVKGPGGVSAANTLYTYRAAAKLIPSISSTSPLQGVPVTLTVTLIGGNSPTGAVTFKDGDATLGTVRLSGGTASLTVASLSVGAHTITAVYSGDAKNASFATTIATINVGARPNPAANADVIGQVASEVSTAFRFARTQLDNANNRLEEIHDVEDPDNSAGGYTPGPRAPVANSNAPGGGSPAVASATPYGDLGGAAGLASDGAQSAAAGIGGASTSAVAPLNGRVPVLGDPGADASVSNPLLAYTPIYADDTPARQSAEGRAISMLGSALPAAFTALNKTMDLPFHLWSTARSISANCRPTEAIAITSRRRG